MEEKFNILDSLKKSAKPEVPANFFNEFSSNLMKQVSQEQLPFKKSDSPEVPAGFFDSFSDQLMDKIAEEEKASATPTPPKQSRSKIFFLKITGAVAVAACLLLLFNLINSEENAVETENVATYSEEETEDAYLAYLDEQEIVDFLIDNDDIVLEEDELDVEDEDIFYFLDDDIEDYYYEEL